jgi:transcriptional regulator with XRE-family HTH domain
MFTHIGETLRRIRKDKRKTLEELGRETSLGRGQLSRIENSHQEATLSTLAKILTANGVSRREFFRRYDLVEAEALALEQAEAAEPALAPPEERRAWPDELRAALDKVELFLKGDADRLRPVAQGAFEVGELVVLFRVVPREPTEALPQPAGEPQPPAPRRAARKKRAPGRQPGRKGAPPSKS